MTSLKRTLAAWQLAESDAKFDIEHMTSNACPCPQAVALCLLAVDLFRVRRTRKAELVLKKVRANQVDLYERL